MELILNYLKGIIFVLYYIFFFQLIGTAFTHRESAPSRIVYGYFIHVICLSLIGIPVLIFMLPWRVFFIGLIIIDILLIAFSIVRIKNTNRKVFPGGMKDFIQKYWFIYFVCVVAILMVMTSNAYMWNDGWSDDSYYLNRITTLPYTSNPYLINIRNGLPVTGYSPFTINSLITFELEGSVYLYITQVQPTLFCRIFLSFVNYFIWACALYMFAEKIIEVFSIEIDKRNIQYFTITLLMICFSAFALVELKLITIRDHWPVNYCMFYGSALTKTIGLLVLMEPFLDFHKLSWKDLLLFGALSFALITRSAIILPIISVVFIVLFIVYSYKKERMLGYLSFVLVLALSLIVGDNGHRFINQASYYLNSFESVNYVVDNFGSLVITIPLIIIFLMTIYYSDLGKNTKDVTLLLFLLGIMFIVNPLNNIAELMSTKYFVFGRAVGSLDYFIIMYCGILLLSFLVTKISFIKYIRPLLFSVLAILISFSSLYVRKRNMVNVKHEINTFIQNPYCIHEGVRELGDTLEKISKNKKQHLYALIPSNSPVYQYEVNIDLNSVNNKHYLNNQIGMSIRSIAPDVSSLITRSDLYPLSDKIEWKDFNKEDFNTFEKFLNSDDKNVKDNMQIMLNKYSINCVVMWNNKQTNFLEQNGFKYITQVSKNGLSFVVYYRP